MLDQAALFLDVRTLAVVAVALTTLWLWARMRTRPAAFLAAAFAALALVVVLPHTGATDVDGVREASVVVLLTFPWLMAAFAWSFEGRLPVALWAAASAVGLVAGWALFGAVLDDAAVASSFVVSFVGLWTVLSVAAAWKLAHAGGPYPLVRARVRTLAGGLVVLNVTLLLVAFDGQPLGDAGITVLLVGSCLLFLAGFVPPPPLRIWWRRDVATAIERMQADLIAAATPDEVARAAVPHISRMLGGAVAMVGPDATVLAEAGFGREDAYETARKAVTDEPLGDHSKKIAVGHTWLVVRTSPYTPLYGREESDLVSALALHVLMGLERAELYTSSVRAREELEAMILGLAHDLRNPTASILGFADVLARDPDDPAEIVGHIRSSAEQLNELVDAMLDLSSVERSSRDVEPVDLADIARKVASRTGASHPQATVRVVGHAPHVTMNPVRAGQLVDNLVGNAVKHAGRDDVTIWVELCETASGGVHLAVHDDGDGVPVVDRERVFALFQRGTNCDGRGSGIGLALVRRIAESLDGHVTLEPSDVGARFVVHLPPEVVQPPADDSAAADPQTGQAPHAPA
jgi:signal transduction histidine kinase